MLSKPLHAVIDHRRHGRVGSVVAQGLRKAGDPALAGSPVAELGGLDLVVHAASAGFAPIPVADVTEEQWDEALGATAKGAFFVAQAAAPRLR